MRRGFMLGLLVLSAFGCERSPRTGPPDIILISIDTLRPDHLGAYGNERAKTPHIDALATKGTMFVNAFAPMGRTTPSLASMLTGLWPHEHGSREVGAPIEHGALVPSLLEEAGYSTMGVTGNSAAGRDEGFATGFDRFAELDVKRDKEGWNAADITDRAIELAANAPRNEPLLLWAHYLDPHWPYEPPHESEASTACSALSGIERGVREANTDGRAQRLLPQCKKAYDEEVAFTDGEVGRLLGRLRETGRLTNAIVVFTSDHGENFGEAGLFYAHGPNVHDANLRVPLIIAGTGVSHGATRREIFRLIDLAPTILALAEIPRRDWPSMRGVDQSPVLREDSGARPNDLLAFAESGGTLVRGNHTHLLSGRPRTGYCINEGRYSLCWMDKVIRPMLFDRDADREQEKDLRHEKPELFAEMLRAKDRWKPGMTRERSVSDGRFKLVERPRFEGGYSRTLYDTHTDPAETKDVQKTQPEALERLSRALSDWTADIPGYTQEALSDEMEAQLKALGYVE